MTMFTRSDKTPDPTSAAKTPERENPPVAAMPETRRVQATAQPLSNPAAMESPGVSIISKALKITGQLESTENIRIDGEVDGDVRGVSVTVGGGAKVKGTVYGDEIELSGTVEGKIEGRKVVLTGTAHMSGDVVHQDIKIESGAYINGNCRPEFGKTENKSARPAIKPAAVREPLMPEKSGNAGSSL